MFEISVEAQFSAAHRLRNYKGKCENMHGHNWRVKAIISGRKLNSQGMIMDFSELKNKLNETIMRLDHKYLNDINYFKNVNPVRNTKFSRKKNKISNGANPTSENIAKYIYDKLCRGKACLAPTLRISVWETDTSCATYYE